MSILRVILLLFRAFFRDRSQMALESLALRQQLAVLHRKAKQPRLGTVDCPIRSNPSGSESILTPAAPSRRKFGRKTVGQNLAGWIFREGHVVLTGLARFANLVSAELGAETDFEPNRAALRQE